MNTNQRPQKRSEADLNGQDAQDEAPRSGGRFSSGVVLALTVTVYFLLSVLVILAVLAMTP